MQDNRPTLLRLLLTPPAGSRPDGCALWWAPAPTDVHIHRLARRAPSLARRVAGRQLARSLCIRRLVLRDEGLVEIVQGRGAFVIPKASRKPSV